MSDFKAKIHHIRFPLGSAPDPAEGAYSAPPDPLALFKRATSKEREGEGGGEGKEVAPQLGVLIRQSFRR